jgi:hypothetical protein
MKLFTTSQIALLDRYTIENEPISDIDLMERASGQITDWILSKYNNDQNVAVFAVVFGQALPDDADNDIVGNELAAVNILLGLESDGSTVLHRGSEYISG